MWLEDRGTSNMLVFFFNDTATTEIYTLSLHDALPISSCLPVPASWTSTAASTTPGTARTAFSTDRKSTRLNSSHQIISYAVFCLKKKNNENHATLCDRIQRLLHIFIHNYLNPPPYSRA